jgi:YqaJ-like viral recombinase domain
MIVHDVSQRTLDWAKLHVGIPTASGFGNLLTPEFKIRDGEMPKTYLYTKIAEKWFGEPLLDLSVFSIEQGEILETEAKPFFELETGRKIIEAGFITADDGLSGCSPDGLLEDDNGLEVKCPSAHVHVKYLVEGKLPKEYAAQVHGSMFVTGRPKWTFVSYRRNFPPFIIEVGREEEIMLRIAEAIRKFHAMIGAAMEVLWKDTNESTARLGMEVR